MNGAIEIAGLNIGSSVKEKLLIKVFKYTLRLQKRILGKSLIIIIFQNLDWNLGSLSCDGDIPVYIGCYSDSSPDRDLPIRKGKKYDKSSCNTACKEYKYFGLQYRGKCWCGHTYGTGPKHVEKPDSACGGAEGIGGSWTNSVYKTCAYSGEHKHFV